MTRDERLRGLYEAHARRDIDAALHELDDDVEWPDVAGGTVLRGRDAVRAYWTAQFAVIDPSVTPTAIAADTDDDRVVAVRVHQVVRDLAGTVLREGDVTHTYTFAGDDADRIVRMVVTA